MEPEDIPRQFFLRVKQSQIMDYKSELNALREIYRTANISPIFRTNLVYHLELGDLIPYICLGDVLEYKYIIRLLPEGQITEFPIFRYGQKFKEYPSLEMLVEDGWQLD